MCDRSQGWRFHCALEFSFFLVFPFPFFSSSFFSFYYPSNWCQRGRPLLTPSGDELTSPLRPCLFFACFFLSSCAAFSSSFSFFCLLCLAFMLLCFFFHICFGVFYGGGAICEGKGAFHLLSFHFDFLCLIYLFPFFDTISFHLFVFCCSIPTSLCCCRLSAVSVVL